MFQIWQELALCSILLVVTLGRELFPHQPWNENIFKKNKGKMWFQTQKKKKKKASIGIGSEAA